MNTRVGHHRIGRRGWISVTTVVTLAVLIPASAATAARPIKAKVSSFTASVVFPSVGSSTSPLTLYQNGGHVDLVANVTNVTTSSSCTFSSSHTISGLPATVPCSDGTADAQVVIPPNGKKRLQNYKVKVLVVGGSGSMSLKIVVLPPPNETAAPPLEPGQAWTVQFPNGYPSSSLCIVETLGPDGTFTADNNGDSGTYSATSQSISETFITGSDSPGSVSRGSWIGGNDAYSAFYFPNYLVWISPGVTPGC